jgi:hypothetical protein
VTAGAEAAAFVLHGGTWQTGWGQAPPSQKAHGHATTGRPQYSGPVPAAGLPSFRLAIDEQVLKTYETVVLRSGLFRRIRGRGLLYVTDARLVFYVEAFSRGAQGSSFLIQEAALASIGGVRAHVSRRMSTGLLLLIMTCGMAFLTSLVTIFILGVIAFGVLTALLITRLISDSARKGSVGVTVSSRENGASAIEFGRAPQRTWADAMVSVLLSPVLVFFRRYNATDVLRGDPGADADELLHELGALVLDLQNSGALAYPRWGLAETYPHPDNSEASPPAPGSSVPRTTGTRSSERKREYSAPGVTNRELPGGSSPPSRHGDSRTAAVITVSFFRGVGEIFNLFREIQMPGEIMARFDDELAADARRMLVALGIPADESEDDKEPTS